MILFFCSFLIVAFGQPAWLSGWLAPLAATCGYALFWKHYQGRFWIGTLWFAGVQLVQLSWMTSIEFQGIYILFFYAGLSFWLGCQFGLITFLIKGRMTPSRMLALASLWTLIEWGRTQILCGFSFNPAGLALAAFLPSMQCASVFGIWGLSFWVIFTNLICLEAIRFFRKRCLILAGAALLPYLLGGLSLVSSKQEVDKKISVALMQTGMLPSEKAPLKGMLDSFVSPYDQWQNMIRYLKQQDTAHWDLIVLPESVVPFPAHRAAYRADVVKKILHDEGIEAPELDERSGTERVSNIFWMQALARHFQSDLIAGLDVEDEQGGNNYAAACHVSFRTDLVNQYEKRVLVPLAEYLPFSFLTPFVAAYGIKDFFTPGAEAKIFHGPVPLSVSICYEETFPHLIREGRLKGASLFVNLTNDNWYPDSILPKQHFDLGRLRAIENGVPLLRACNSGITSVVDRFGRVTALFEKKAGVLSAAVDVCHHKTLYTLWGDTGIVVLCLIFLTHFLRNHLAQKASSRLTSYQLDPT